MKRKIFDFWTEFKKFISKGNVVDMAVGVAVATAFTAIVNAFTKGFISPIIALLTKDATLTDLKIVIREAVLDTDGETVVTEEIAILWGAFVQAIIDFLIIAFVMFIFLKIFMKVSAKTQELREDAVNKIMGTDEEEAAKAEAEAKAAEAAKAEAEAKAAEEKAKLDAEQARKDRELELLEQIAAAVGSKK